MKHRVRGVSIYRPKRRGAKRHPYLLAWGPRHNRTVITGSTDLQVCIELASKIASIGDRVKHGLADPDAARHFVEARRTLTQHLNDYERSLVNQGGTKKHATQMRCYAETILDFSGAKYIVDLIPSRLQTQLAKVKGSEATRKRYFDALHGFLAWGVSDHRWPAATMTMMPQMRYAHDPVRRRRVLSLAQLGHLIDTTEASKEVHESIRGSVRALIYLTAATTALRVSELGGLTLNDVGESGFYVLGKNQRRTLVPVPPALLARIKELSSRCGQTLQLFPWPANPARMLRADLKQAGIPFKTPDGVFDFHSLRHQSGTILASAGVPAKAVQAHMRHSDIRLTLGTYGHLLDSDLSRAQDAIRSAIGVQRLAQRNPFPGVLSSSLKGREMSGKTDKTHWSDGESNPDLLNAIQQQTLANLSADRHLVNNRGRRIAPGAAQRLLRRLYVRVAQRQAVQS